MHYRSASIAAFTLMELIVVIGIIAVLATLTFTGARMATESSKINRTKAEIVAIETAVNSYKLDNGEYPPESASVKETEPSRYVKAGIALYEALTGGESEETKIYLPDLKPGQIGGGSNQKYIKDPFGNPYGYSCSSNVEENPNYPEVSIWSTGGEFGDATNKWIGNW